MRTLLIAFIGGIVGTVFTSMVVLAWTGPTSAPPSQAIPVEDPTSQITPAPEQDPLADAA